MSKLQARKIVAEYLIIDDGIIDLYKSVLSINNRLKKENENSINNGFK